MVNQAEQPIDNAEAPVDSGNTTTDITEEFAGVNTFEDTSSPPEPTTEPSPPEGQQDQGEASTETPDVAEPPAPAPAQGVESLQQMEQRLREMEQQNAQYMRDQEQLQVHAQSEQMKQQLEQQGWQPEQAQQYTQDWVNRQSEMSNLRQQYEQQYNFIRGQTTAAEHFANRYKLQLSDLTELRKYNTPEEMEIVAKRIKSDRDKDAEIARLRAQLVPNQTFDDSQSTPTPTNNQDALLDRYNQGDRSEQAQAAARRAAGLG